MRADRAFVVMVDKGREKSVKKLGSPPNQLHQMLKRMEELEYGTNDKASEVHQGTLRVTVLEQCENEK